MTTSAPGLRSLAPLQQAAGNTHAGDATIHVVPPADPRAPASAEVADGAVGETPLAQRVLDADRAPAPIANRQLSALERMDDELLRIATGNLNDTEATTLASTSKALRGALTDEVAARSLQHGVLAGLQKEATATAVWLRAVIPNGSPFQRASALFRAGLYEQALPATQAWIAMERAGNSGGHTRLATIHLQTGHPELAIIAAKEAMTRDKHCPAAETLLRAHLLMGNVGLAGEALKKLSAHFPERITLHRALVLHAQGQTAAARLALDELARAPDPMSRKAAPLAEAYAWIGDTDAALALMKKAGESEFASEDMVGVALSPLTAGLTDPRWTAVRVKAQELAEAAKEVVRGAEARGWPTPELGPRILRLIESRLMRMG